jgi:hypothetical protein
MISEDLATFYFERSEKFYEGQRWYTRLLGRLQWRLFSRDFCVECNKVTYWHTSLVRQKENGPPVGQKTICKVCGLEMVSSPYPDWDELIGDITVSEEIAAKYLHPMR